MGRGSVLDLLGPYVEAPPRDVARPEGRARLAPPLRDELHLETGVVRPSGQVGRRRSCTGACSALVHAAGLGAVITLPLLLTSALPEPTGTVHAFLVEPLSLPPPPPPPAPVPRAAAPRIRAETRTTPTSSFVAPVEVPTELRPEEGLDLGVEGGVAGGVEGGIPGGVVGAIVGGLPDAAPPPPTLQPVHVDSGLVHEPRKIRHVAPVYPPVAATARIEGSVVLEAFVDVRGRVVEVEVIQGHSILAKAALEAVRQWAYTPTLLDGVPVPVILTVTVHFEIEPGGGSDRP
jgi:protein TonB